jgi:TPR repeat protein
LYTTGEGVKQDFKEAVKWKRKAADQGLAKAQYNLAGHYGGGLGVEKDEKEAAKWYRKASEGNLPQAWVALGSKYYFGKGVEKDFKEAVKWYRKAAEQEWAYAQTSLAQMYRDGKGVKQDYKKAFEWFTKAAEQGYPIADRGLGHLYLVGWGVPKDNEKAYAWFTISVANGLADAKKSMSSVAKRMTPNQITKAEALVKEMIKKNPKLVTLAQDKPKPLPPPKLKVRLAGMMVWGEKKRVFLDVRLPDWGGGWEGFRALEEGEMSNGVEVLSIDPEKGAVKLKIKRTFDTIKGQIVSDVVQHWPAVPKANPQKKGSVTLSFSKAPIDMVLDVFSDLSGRTIIANYHVRQGFLDFKPKGPMSEIGTLEAIQALLAAKGIGIEPLGNKFVRVLPLAQLDAKRVPKNGGAFLIANEPPVEKGKIVIRAGHTMQGIPLETFLDEFSALTGRTIIAPVKLPRVRIDFQLENDLSFNEAMEFYQALLTVNGIGVVLQGDKSALVLPASYLPHPLFYLGVAFRDGEGVEKDEKEAVRWFRKAAEQGYAMAQVELGKVYYYGQGVKKDNTEAIKWYRKAAEQGYSFGQYNLGQAYSEGVGVKEDIVEAVKWWRKAAEQGNVYAQNNLFYTYRDGGKGLKKDDKEAVKWLRKMAEQGDANSQNRMGRVYVSGFGLKRDLKEAAKWFRKAGEQGNADAQYNLGMMYANGEGVVKNAETAYIWTKLAHDNGLEMAEKNKSTLKQMIGVDFLFLNLDLRIKEMIKKNPKLLKKK